MAEQFKKHVPQDDGECCPVCQTSEIVAAWKGVGHINLGHQIGHDQACKDPSHLHV